MIKIRVFSATWCPGCLITERRLEKIQAKNNVTVEKYYYDLNKDAFEEYEIGNKIPTFLFEKDGKIFNKVIGEKTEKELQKIINTILGDINE